MRRVLSKKILSFAAVSVFASLVSINSAAALDYSGEDHCFAGGASRATLYVDDEYANGTLQDEEQVEAVEELLDTQWSLRLSSLPFHFDASVFRGSFAHTHEGKAREYSFFEAWTAAELEYQKERFNRRTGSKYMYVRPEMKKLSRLRAQTRIAKRKPCNPNILYLG